MQRATQHTPEANPSGFMDGLRKLTDRLKGFTGHDAPGETAPGVDEPSLREMIARTKDVIRKGDIQVPIFPGPAQKIMGMLGDPNARVSALAETIKADTGLTAQILRIANSPAYSGGTKILSIKRAVNHLGLQRIRSLLFTIVRNNLFPRGSHKQLHTAYFQQAMAVAAAAEAFGPLIKEKVEHRFLYGILHNIGKSCMLGVIAQMQRDGQLPRDLDETTTRTIINATYIPCGTVLAIRWKLPRDFEQIIHYHREPESAEPQFKSGVLLTHLALLLCTTWGTGYKRDDLRIIFNSPHIIRLGIGPADIDHAAQDTLRRYETLVENFS